MSDEAATDERPEGHDPNAERLAAEEAERNAAASELAERQAHERNAEEARVAEVERVERLRDELLQHADAGHRIHARMTQMLDQGAHADDDLDARRRQLADWVELAKAKLRDHPDLARHSDGFHELVEYAQVAEAHRQLARRLEELAR